MMMSLEVSFKAVSRKYIDNETKIENLWQKIAREHSTRGRYYHNMSHLEHLLVELGAVGQHINDWESIVFSIAFHDIVYSVHRKDNEARSSDVAKQSLLSLNVPQTTIDRCDEIILATKSHLMSRNADTNYFTDADLSILGSSWAQYNQYAQNVRLEYRFYPDFVYRPGRKKVLHHFLSMNKIFKTKDFHDRYEISARHNLAEELRLLA